MSETYRRTAGSSRGKRSYVQRTQTSTEGQPTTRIKRRRSPDPQVSSDDEGPASRGPTHVENKVSSAFQNFERGSNRTETKITNSTINISQVPERNIPQELKRVLEKLSAAEARAEAGDPNQAIAALDEASHFFPAVETSHEFVFSLAKKLRKSGQARFRAVAFYFCSASFIKFGDSGISHCMAGIGKVCHQTDAAQNLAIPLTEKLHAMVKQNIDPLQRAFCFNWFAFACDTAKDCRRAIDYATQGLDLMEQSFEYNKSPRYQVYCRLLLTRGEAHYHLQEHVKAATDLKRAYKTCYMAEDFGKKGRTVIASKIKQCRKTNNVALGFSH